MVSNCVRPCIGRVPKTGWSRKPAVTDSGAREAFLAATFELHRYPDQDLRLFEGLALLRLAPGPFRKIEPDWLAGIERIVTVAEQILLPSKQHGSPPASNGHTPSANGMVADDLLPQLTQLQDRAMMSASLAGALGEPVIVTGIDVVRHKPGRRAVLRYAIDRRGSREIFYGKTFASERGAGVHQVTAQIASARAFGPDVALPDPVAFVPALKLLAQQEVAGFPIQQLLLSGETQLAARIATVLHHFHVSGLNLGRTHGLQRELHLLNQRVDQVGEISAESGLLADHCLVRIREIESAGFAWRHNLVHRNFYHDQVLVGEQGLAVLDLDDAAMSEPAVDVASFLAHLLLLGAQRPGHEANLEAVANAFRVRYLELDDQLDTNLLKFLTAATLVRLAGIHVSRNDGERVAESLLERAALLLAT